MTKIQELAINDAAYRSMKTELTNRYPPKWFVAFGAGRLIADTESFETMLVKLEQIGWDPMNVMVFRLGDDVPDDAIIFFVAGSGPV